jgi:hypothetical protein
MDAPQKTKTTLYDAFSSDDGLRTLFIVIFVATLLTIYEYSLFYFVVVPSVKDQVDQGISSATKGMRRDIKRIKEYIMGAYTNGVGSAENMADMFSNSQLSKEIENRYDAEDIEYIKKQVQTGLSSTVGKVDEGRLLVISILETLKSREKVLTDKINLYTVATGGVILAVLFGVMISIKRTLADRGQDLGGYVWQNGIVTITLILIFNAGFYIYGKKFKYMGSVGNEELVHYLYEKM